MRFDVFIGDLGMNNVFANKSEFSNSKVSDPYLIRNSAVGVFNPVNPIFPKMQTGII
jgi:hypothetical protein